MSKVVLVIGTGTIGEPLIGMLARGKGDFGIDKLLFYKRSPLRGEVAKVRSLCARGASLVVSDGASKLQFEQLGHKVDMLLSNALMAADVIIDCTPAGNKMKERYYLPLQLKDTKKRMFIAQGSEKGFGIPYAHGINDVTLPAHDNYIQIVSCNTHNIAALVKSVSPDFSKVIMGDFVCIRRANDVSQQGNFIASPEVGKHSDPIWGTHHARDAADLIATIADAPNIYSSAMRVNSQYMHVVRFSMVLDEELKLEEVIQRFADNEFVCLTEKMLTNQVFSFGRDHGQYGRIYNHTVISRNTLQVQHGKSSEGAFSTRVTGFCFTPQDGNSLISSCAAMLYGLHGDKYLDYTHGFKGMLYDEL